MTGAPMPGSADAVVPLEDAEETGATVVVRGAPGHGAHVRAAGHDVRAGDAVPIPAATITPAAIGLLAAMGVAHLEVRRRPRVAILSTGD